MRPSWIPGVTWKSVLLTLLLVPALVLQGCDGKQSGILPKRDTKALESVGPRTVVLANGLEAVEGELLLRFKDEVGVASMDRVSALGGTVAHSYRSVPGLQLVRVPATMAIEDAVAAFQASPEVLYAEPNYIYSIGATPDDARYAELWGMNNLAQTGGTVDADINAPEAWDISTGSTQAIVAIIDTGINYNHEDLAANTWVNPGEIPDNDVDDDGNGYVDDVHGINAITNTGDPLDDHNHGSHTFGTIAGRGNNAIGVAGVNWTAQVLGCKFLSASGSGSSANAVKCLDYIYDLKTRASNPVDIAATNNSWGGGSFSQALQDAIARHVQAGILFVAAAGNSNANNDNTITYPSGYYLPNIVAVAATDHNDAKASFSSYGRRRVHVGAPGVNILSTNKDNTGYMLMSGTSMATPHTTGLVALLKAQDPTRDWKALRNLVLSGGTDVPSMNGITVTGKRIRAADTGGVGSLTCDDRVVSSRLLPIASDIQVLRGSLIDIAALNINCAVPNGDVVLTITPGGNTVTLTDDGQGIDQVAGDGVYSTQWSPPTAGTFTLAFPDGDAITVTALDVYRPALTIPTEWRTITGTSLDIPDNIVAAVGTPFPIRYANHAGFDTAYISAEGYLSFNTNLARTSNSNIPYSSFQTLISPLWDSLHTAAAPPGNVYQEVLGTAPSREWVIEWREIGHNSRRTDVPYPTVTFQVVFKEGSSDVQFNYLDVDFRDGTDTYDSGGSATVGVQVNSTSASRFSYNTKSLSDRPSLLFKTNAPPFLNALEVSVPAIDEGGSTTLSSTFSDVDGAADADWTAEWDFDYNGTTFTVDDSQVYSAEGPISIDHTFTQSGRYLVGLRVLDKDGGPSAIRTLVVTVNNVAPVAVAPTVDPAAPIEGEVVTFAASFSDVVDIDNPWKAEWDFDYDGVTFHLQKSQTYSSQGNVSVTNTYMEDGTYTVALRVVDRDNGVSAIVTTQVVIADVSPTITATYASPDTGTEPVTVQLNVTAESGSPTPSADPVRYYLWDFDGDGNPDQVSTDPRAVHRFLDNPDGGDTYQVKVWVEDEDSSTMQIIPVVVANAPPSLAAVPANHSALEGSLFTYQLAGSDPAGRNDPLSYRLVTAPAGMSVSGNGLIQWIPAFAQSGRGTGVPYSVTVELSDDDGATVSASFTVSALWLDADDDGMPDTWERVNGLDPTTDDSAGDANRDGVSNLDESNNANGGPHTPGRVQPSSPLNSARILTNDVTLAVDNTVDADGDAVSYVFELFSDEALTQRVIEVTTSEGSGSTTSVVLDDTKLTSGAADDDAANANNVDLADNSWLWWRARATDGSHPGPWSDVQKVFYNPFNDLPSRPVAISPADGVTTSNTTPTLVVLNATDAEGEALTYEFELRKDTADGSVVASSTTVAEGEGGTSFVVANALQNGRYYWKARARDASGGTSEWTVAAMFNVGTSGGCGCAATTGGGLMGSLFPMLLIPLGLAFFRRRRIY